MHVRERRERAKGSEALRLQVMEELKRSSSQVIKMFTEWDLNNDGVVDGDELHQAIINMGFKEATPPLMVHASQKPPPGENGGRDFSFAPPQSRPKVGAVHCRRRSLRSMGPGECFHSFMP